MIRQPIQKRWFVFLGVVSVLLFLTAYTGLSVFQHYKNPNDTTIPDWRQMYHGVAKAITPDRGGDIWVVVDALATAKRLFLGLGCGVIGAVILGMLMGCFKWLEAFFLPPLSLLAKLPPTAMLAVFFVLVGTDTEMYVTMIAFGVLPTLAQAVCLAIQDVPDELLDKTYTLGASPAEVIWNVVFRYVLPKLIDAIRLQIGPAVVFLMAAEMVVGHVGFGYRIRLESKLLDMNVVYPYLALLAGFGYLMDYLLRFSQRILCPWYIGERRS